MAVSGKGVTYGGKGGNRISTLVRNGKVSQTGAKRAIAAVRNAMGAAGQARAMKNWGLKAKMTKGGKIARGSKIRRPQRLMR